METYLEKLTLVVADLAKKAIKSGSASPKEELFVNWELDDFKYTEKGVENQRAHSKTTAVKSWFISANTLADEATKLKEFVALEKKIKKRFPKSGDPKYNLQIFCRYILSIYLEHPRRDNKKAVSKVIKNFINELENKPIFISAAFKIYGLVLESDMVKLEEGISIRKAKKEDFEVPARLYGFSNSMISHSYHSVVLKIDFKVTKDKANNVLFQNKADKYIALFRIFRVGSIYYNSYDMSSDAILPPFLGGMITIGGRGNVQKASYLVKKTDEKALLSFLNKLPLPKDIYNAFERKINYLTIAFDRYSEALLETFSAERKITNVVMGLEALFSTDNVELKFKLSTRVSKLISFFGQDPVKAKNVLSLAYDIRSSFSHGGHLNTKLNNKITNQYGDVDNFLRMILDYLRIGIIVAIGCGIKRENLIDLIDDSMIDTRKSAELKSYLIKLEDFI